MWGLRQIENIHSNELIITFGKSKRNDSKELSSEEMTKVQEALQNISNEKERTLVLTQEELSELRSVLDTNDTGDEISFLKDQIKETTQSSGEIMETVGWNLSQEEKELLQMVDSQIGSILFEWNKPLFPKLKNLAPAAQQNFQTGFSFFFSELILTELKNPQGGLSQILSTINSVKDWEKQNSLSIGDFKSILNSMKLIINEKSITSLNAYFEKNTVTDWWVTQAYFMNPMVSKELFSRVHGWEDVQKIIIDLENRTLEITETEQKSLEKIGTDVLGVLWGSGILGVSKALKWLWKSTRELFDTEDETITWIKNFIWDILNSPEWWFLKWAILMFVNMMWIGDLFDIYDEKNISMLRSQIATELWDTNTLQKFALLFAKKNSDKVNKNALATMKSIKDTWESLAKTTVRVLGDSDFQEIVKKFFENNEVIDSSGNYTLKVNEAIMLYAEYMIYTNADGETQWKNVKEFKEYKEKPKEEDNKEEKPKEEDNKGEKTKEGAAIPVITPVIDTNSQKIETLTYNNSNVWKIEWKYKWIKFSIAQTETNNFTIDFNNKKYTITNSKWEPFGKEQLHDWTKLENSNNYGWSKPALYLSAWWNIFKLKRIFIEDLLKKLSWLKNWEKLKWKDSVTDHDMYFSEITTTP